jgi:hypothetical protein
MNTKTKSPKTYSTARAFRAAIEERAKQLRDASGMNLQLARRQFAFEAFLRRVPTSGQPLVLKGGFLLHMRYRADARPTKDLDAAINDAGMNNLDTAVAETRLRAVLQAVAMVPEPDFFTFDIGAAVADLGEDREFVGFRYSVKALLGEREFDTFHVDCTVGDALVLPLEKITVGTAFGFTTLPPVQVDGIGPAQHIAEKLHAICRERRGGKDSNRTKDLFDVILVLQHGVTATQVAAVLPEVFRLGGQTPFNRLTRPPPEAWREPFTAMAVENGLETTFDEAVSRHSELCRDILTAIGA